MLLVNDMLYEVIPYSNNYNIRLINKKYKRYFDSMVIIPELFTLSSGNISKFIQVMKILKEINHQANFKFSSAGLEIICVSHTKIILYNLKLDKYDFKYYNITEDVTIGLDINNFYNIIGNIKSDVTMGISKCKTYLQVMSMYSYLPIFHKYTLINLADDDITLPPIEHVNILTIPTKVFNIKKIYTSYTIKYNDKLHIEYISLVLQTRFKLNYKNPGNEYIFHGPSSNLDVFKHLNKLSDRCQICLKESYPLIIICNMYTNSKLLIACTPLHYDSDTDDSDTDGSDTDDA
jgi:hypothetical protein